MNAKEFHPRAATLPTGYHYVYGILIRSELIYVGSGSLGRAQKSCLEKHGDSIVVIKCQSRREAFILEAEMILKHRPKLNVWVPDADGRSRKLIRPMPRRKIKCDTAPSIPAISGNLTFDERSMASWRLKVIEHELAELRQ